MIFSSHLTEIFLCRLLPHEYRQKSSGRKQPISNKLGGGRVAGVNLIMIGACNYHYLMFLSLSLVLHRLLGLFFVV